MRPLASAPDKREAENGGDSKNAHFSDAVQRASMAQVFSNRRQDILDYGGDDFDRAD